MLNAPTAYTPPAALLWGLWHEEQLVSGHLQVATAPSAVGTAENGVETPPHTAENGIHHTQLSVQGLSTSGQVLPALKSPEVGMTVKAPI